MPKSIFEYIVQQQKDRRNLTIFTDLLNLICQQLTGAAIVLSILE